MRFHKFYEEKCFWAGLLQDVQRREGLREHLHRQDIDLHHRHRMRLQPMRNTMRHLLALFALSLVLVACDDSTTPMTSNLAATDSIPSAPNPPRLAVTVLTGTKAAPVDSPTVKLKWWYKDDSISAGWIPLKFINGESNGSMIQKGSIDSAIFNVGCFGNDSLNIIAAATPRSKGNAQSYALDTLTVYCK